MSILSLMFSYVLGYRSQGAGVQGFYAHTHTHAHFGGTQGGAGAFLKGITVTHPSLQYTLYYSTPNDQTRHQLREMLMSVLPSHHLSPCPTAPYNYIQ